MGLHHVGQVEVVAGGVVGPGRGGERAAGQGTARPDRRGRVDVRDARCVPVRMVRRRVLVRAGPRISAGRGNGNGRRCCSDPHVVVAVGLDLGRADAQAAGDAGQQVGSLGGLVLLLCLLMMMVIIITVVSFRGDHGHRRGSEAHGRRERWLAVAVGALLAGGGRCCGDGIDIAAIVRDVLDVFGIGLPRRI